MSRGAFLKLYYDSLLVGEIAGSFEHQGTWFGTFTSRLPSAGSDIQRRLAEFIAFCDRWHQRLKQGNNPDADEFDEFGSIVRSGNWQVVDERGERTAIDQAPVFVEGEVSWVCQKSRPPGSVT